jgi:hypothetical protein
MRFQLSRSSITTRLPAALLGDRLFATVSGGHLAVDVLNGTRSVLLTYLSGTLGLTNTALSLVSTVYAIQRSYRPTFVWSLGGPPGRAGWSLAACSGWGLFFLALIVPGPFSLACWF